MNETPQNSRTASTNKEVNVITNFFCAKDTEGEVSVFVLQAFLLDRKKAREAIDICSLAGGSLSVGYMEQNQLQGTYDLEKKSAE